MFKLSRTITDHTFIKENLRGKSLSGGTFIEVHIDSLLDQKLTTHSDFIIDHENTIPAKSVISHVKRVQEEKTRKSGETYITNMVCFKVNGKIYTVDEGTFSMIIKRCFHTKKGTVCFSLRDEDRPQN